MCGRGAHLHGRGTSLGGLVSTGGGPDFLGVSGAMVDCEMAVHGTVGTCDMLRGVWARGMGCEGHGWLY